MKSPDEIKKGLECCKPIWKNDHWKTCDRNCPYAAEADYCRTMLNGDALAYISQLESQNRCFKEIKESCERRMVDMAQRETNWVSVEERLPEDEKDVAVIVKLKKGNWMCLTAFRLPFGGWWINRGAGLDYAEVTHWCPLPEAPKEY